MPPPTLKHQMKNERSAAAPRWASWGAEWTAEVPIRRERAHHRLGITGGQRGQVAADDINGASVPGLQDWRPDVAMLINRPLAAVGAEHYRLVVRGFGDHRHRPRQFPPAAI